MRVHESVVVVPADDAIHPHCVITESAEREEKQNAVHKLEAQNEDL